MNSFSKAVFSLFKFILSRASYLPILLLGLTLRIEQENQTGANLSETQLIYCVWHKNTFCPMFLHRWEQIILFVAAGRRGELFGAILKLLGYNPKSLLMKSKINKICITKRSKNNHMNVSKFKKTFKINLPLLKSEIVKTSHEYK